MEEYSSWYNGADEETREGLPNPKDLKYDDIVKVQVDVYEGIKSVKIEKDPSKSPEALEDQKKDGLISREGLVFGYLEYYSQKLDANDGLLVRQAVQITPMGAYVEALGGTDLVTQDNLSGMARAGRGVDVVVSMWGTGYIVNGGKILNVTKVGHVMAGSNFGLQLMFKQDLGDVDVTSVISSYMPALGVMFDSKFDFTLNKGFRMLGVNKSYSEGLVDYAFGYAAFGLGKGVGSKSFMEHRFGLNLNYFKGLNSKGATGSALWQQSFIAPLMGGNIMAGESVNK